MIDCRVAGRTKGRIQPLRAIRYVGWTLFFLFVALSIPWPIEAKQGLILTDAQGRYPLGPYLEILEDKTKSWTIDDVSSNAFEGRYAPGGGETPNLGFSRSAYWVRFRVANESRSVSTWRLEIGFPDMNHIDLYVPRIDGDGFEVRKTGNLLPFSTRDVAYHNFVFDVTVVPRTEQTIYLRFENGGVMRFPLTLWSPSAFEKKAYMEALKMGAFYGALLVMLCYNFFLFLTLRDKSYIHYLLVISVFVLTSAWVEGLFQPYLWGSVWLNRYAPGFLTCLFFVFSLEFGKSFLTTRTRAPVFHKVMLAVQGCLATLATLSFFLPRPLVMTSTVVLGITGFLLLIVAGFAVWRGGYTPARYFLVAWVPLVVTVAVSLLSRLGLLPVNALGSEGPRIGMLLLLTLLSFALADRINVFRREREEASAELVRSQRETLRVKDASNIALQKTNEELALSVADRKKVEAALRESERQYRLIAENVSDVVWILDMETFRFRYVSPSVERLRGYTPEEILEQDMAAAVTPSSLQHIMDALPGRLAEFHRGINRSYVDEIEQPCKDGSTVWTETTTRYVLDGESGHGEVYGVSRDISERRKAEETIRHQANLVDNVSEAIISTTPELVIKSWNRAAANLYGWSAEEAIGKEIVGLLDTEYAGTSRAEVVKELFEKGSVQTEVIHTGKKGNRLHTAVRITAVRDGKGDITETVGILTDIAERKRAERHTQLTNRVLEALNSPVQRGSLTGRILLLLKEHLDVDAAAIRARSGEDFPYAESVGFPEDFLEAENSLCLRDEHQTIVRDGHGRPRLACLCGQVITGDPNGLSRFFTDKGSFWTNDALDLLSSLKQEGTDVPLRGRCMSEGYQSIALIPLRSEKEVVGLLQFEDKRPGRLALEEIEFLEDIGTAIGVALLRKESEEKVRASEERYRSIFENAVEGIFQSTPDGRLFSVNPAEAKMHGYASPEEMMVAINRKTEALWKSRDDAARFWKLVKQQGYVSSFETEGLRKDGSTFWASLNVRAIRDHEERVLHYDGTVEDVTERKRLEEQFRQAQKMEAIGTLAGGVAHDFNNLLTVIMGFSELIQAEIGEDDRLGPYIDQIVGASGKAAELTQRLLAFSRKQRINLEPHVVNDIVRSTAKLLSRLLPEDIELRMDLTDADLVARVDVGHIDQVFMNLATNARDAMPKGGLLVIKTEAVKLGDEFHETHGFGEPGEYVLLSVSDTGTGMDGQTMKRIFDPFFTTKEVGKGTGLGLASVYGTVKQHDGYITVSSAIGRGTTFRIYLPLVDSSHQEKAAPAEEIKKGRETVLVAEDDPGVRDLLTRILEGQGYSVVPAMNGDDAVGVYGKLKVDLVILDVVMPGKNGREVLDEILRIDPGAKAIFVSGHPGDVVIDKGVRSGAVDFVQKPVAVAHLLSKVREVLDR